MVSAIDKGFACIGFSGHSYVEFDPGCGMDEHALEAYRKEIRALKETYKGRIRIFCGIELDSYSDMPEGEFDYVIGSVHYLDGTSRPAAVDDTPEELMACFDKISAALEELEFDEVEEVITTMKGFEFDDVSQELFDTLKNSMVKQDEEMIEEGDIAF